ncbi:hypothetical protein OLP40_04470 [Campylobacter jejuni]|nr:hypothetical protein [Campylobacter jejuni]MCW1359067.1 hypothetical protein [Campylobacter jejuni]HDZ4932650.1 hypothetical protein [Campylobacter jejuni]HDZ4936863.1 hypothetical protein [Campylobacter jejuni]HDZ4939760.1 hypothetical protein [Campylobacter jejuni]
MKNIILGLAVIVSLSSIALASNHSYHSKKNLSNLQQDGILTCENFHNCQTTNQPIYQHQACAKLGICINH